MGKLRETGRSICSYVLKRAIVGRPIYIVPFLLLSCLESYQPPAISDDVNILVVDGFINGNDGSASVKLSRATPLSSTELPQAEIGATVLIGDNTGGTFALAEAAPGNYTYAGINVLATNQYRLMIRTNNGNEYASDFIEITQSPAIDSINWKQDRDALILSVNTHDPAGTTKYYQWSFDETWEYTSKHYSSFKLVDGEPVLRSDNINLCWASSSSTEILIASTNRLLEDIIQNYPITTIPKSTGKYSRRYSILVEQRAITKEAHNFWLELKKTTESLGSLFDPLPSQVLGNITSADGSEPVLGYFSGGYTTKKRLFINQRELPTNLFYNPNLYVECETDSIKTEELKFYGPILLISSYPPYSVQGYTTASSDCIDCRLAGGTTVRPDFW